MSYIGERLLFIVFFISSFCFFLLLLFLLFRCLFFLRMGLFLLGAYALHVLVSF